MIKDIEDVRGDSQLNYKTLPVIAGIPLAILILRLITIFFIILSMLPIFTSYYLWYYTPLIVFLIHLPLLYIIIRLTDNITPKECAKYSKVLRLVKRPFFPSTLSSLKFQFLICRAICACDKTLCNFE